MNLKSRIESLEGLTIEKRPAAEVRIYKAGGLPAEPANGPRLIIWIPDNGRHRYEA